MCQKIPLRHVCKGKGRKEAGKTIWKPISVSVLQNGISNFFTLNAILEYLWWRGCLSNQTGIDGSEEIAFLNKIGTKKKEIKRNQLFFPCLLPSFQHMKYSNSAIFKKKISAQTRFRVSDPIWPCPEGSFSLREDKRPYPQGLCHHEKL